MKFLIIALAMTSMNVMAGEIVSFKCDFTDITYINQFSLEAKSVEEVDGKFHNVEFDFNLRNAGRDSTFERSVVTRDGTVRFVEAGTLGNKRSIQLATAVKGAELEHINILIDVARPLTSQIRFLNGKTFHGTCKSL